VLPRDRDIRPILYVIAWVYATDLVTHLLRGFVGPGVHSLLDLADGIPMSVVCGVIGGRLVVLLIRRKGTEPPSFWGAKVLLVVLGAATLLLLTEAIAGPGREALVANSVVLSAIGLAGVVIYRRGRQRPQRS
jgi:uncharacterized membrane protein YeaQ/YmgE (transglycosylase-associated protein family)